MDHRQKTEVGYNVEAPEDDREHRRRVVAAWNEFDEKHGHFAKEWNRDFMSENADR